MSRTLLSLPFVLLACNLSFAQETSKCPSVHILGPAGIVAPNEIARYEAIVYPKQTVQLGFEWGTTGGKIKTGQGTPQIEVIQPSGTLTATVTVTGFPQGCTATASVASSFEIDPGPVLLGRVRGKLNKKTGDRVASWIRSDSTSPHTQFYLLVYGIYRSHIDSKIRSLKRALASADPSRITYVGSKAKDDKVEVWAVPPGADPPQP